MAQTSIQEQLWVSVLLLNSLELPPNADVYAETTMRSRFSAPLPEVPHDADVHAETTMRFCFSSKPTDADPERGHLCRNDQTFLPFC